MEDVMNFIIEILLLLNAIGFLIFPFIIFNLAHTRIGIPNFVLNHDNTGTSIVIFQNFHTLFHIMQFILLFNFVLTCGIYVKIAYFIYFLFVMFHILELKYTDVKPHIIEGWLLRYKGLIDDNTEKIKIETNPILEEFFKKRKLSSVFFKGILRDSRDLYLVIVYIYNNGIFNFVKTVLSNGFYGKRKKKETGYFISLIDCAPYYYFVTYFHRVACDLFGFLILLFVLI